MTEFALWILIAVSSQGNFAPTKLDEFKDQRACLDLKREYEALSSNSTTTKYRCAPATIVKR